MGGFAEAVIDPTLRLGPWEHLNFYLKKKIPISQACVPGVGFLSLRLANLPLRAQFDGDQDNALNLECIQVLCE